MSNPFPLNNKMARPLWMKRGGTQRMMGTEESGSGFLFSFPHQLLLYPSFFLHILDTRLSNIYVRAE